MFRKQLFLFYFLLLICVNSMCQVEDSTFIERYEKPNTIELNNTYNSSRLHFYTSHHHTEAYNFFSNNGLFTGVYLNYRFLTIGYGINVPFTSRDNSVKGFKAYRLRFNSYFHGWGVSGNMEVYKGLLSRTYKNTYTPIEGVRYTSINGDFFHVANARRYSYKAALDLTEKQLKSSGSLLLHIRPSYYALGLQSGTEVNDSAQRFFRNNPRWLTVTGSVGYGYNFVWDGGKWIVGPRVEAGAGGLYQFGIRRELKLAAFFRTALSAGYSTGNKYIYLATETSNTTNVLASSIIADDKIRVTLTAGLRLRSLKKKILGVL